MASDPPVHEDSEVNDENDDEDNGHNNEPNELSLRLISDGDDNDNHKSTTNNTASDRSHSQNTLEDTTKINDERKCQGSQDNEDVEKSTGIHGYDNLKNNGYSFPHPPLQPLPTPHQMQHIHHQQLLHAYPHPQHSLPQEYLTYEHNLPCGYHHQLSAPFGPSFPSGYGLSSPIPTHFYHPPATSPHLQPFIPPPTESTATNNVSYHTYPPSALPSPSAHNHSIGNTTAMAHAVYHENAARMRDHAAAYANAAAGAAWAAAQIANAAAEFASSTSAAVLPPPPHHLPLHPSVAFPTLHSPPPTTMMHTPNSRESSNLYYPSPKMPYDSVSINQNQEYLSGRANQKSETVGSEQHELRKYEKNHRSRHSNSSEQNSSSLPERRNADLNNGDRKRLQRMHPNDVQVSLEQTEAYGTIQSYPQQRGKIRRRLRSDCDSSTTSSGSSFMPSNRRSSKHHNKKKARSDESLRGKTAVAALFEWCTKRQITLNFVVEQSTPEEFEYLVYLDGYKEYENGDQEDDLANTGSSFESERVWGRGRGRNKGAAKQEAARRTLQSLLPGVVFDDATGILIEVPTTTSSPLVTVKTAVNSLDDLAPNLAKQLAIGQNNSIDRNPSSNRKIQQSKRTLDIYPGTSTTSDDGEDENAYYTSRGASVCSVLLHAVVQIDTERIPEGPSFTYHVAPPPQLFTSGSDNQQGSLSLRKNGRPLSAVRATRGSFTCTARLKIRLPSKHQPSESVIEEATETDSKSETGIDSDLFKRKCDEEKSESCKQEDELVDKFSSLGNETAIKRDSVAQLAMTESFLEASGTGGTKRDARHVASARLLALLFPECKDMVEVKAAAEAMREQYAATKAQYKQQRQFLQPYNRHQHQKDSDDDSAHGLLEQASSRCESLSSSAFAKSTDPPIPSEVCQRIRRLIEPQLQVLVDDHEEREVNVSDEYVFSSRKLDRTEQIDYQVECALQMLNDRDEEGRTLPDEVTAHDVGRLVLRRAEPEDLARIRHFQFSSPQKYHRGQNTAVPGYRDPSSARMSKIISNALTSVEDPVAGNEEVDISVCPNNCVILLLCRAIAAFEDPPLGCAVLSLGFSIEKGCLLRLVEIAREKHLPMERFLECLQSFASCMKSTLETTTVTSGSHVREVTFVEILSVLDSYLGSDYSKPRATTITSSSTSSLVNELEKRVFGSVSATKLQSVKEESEVSDSSTAEKRPTKRASKPSKRSRFE